MNYPPQQGPYGPQNYPPQRPKSKARPVLIGCGALVGVFVLLGIIGAIVGSGQKTNDQAANTAAPPSDSSTPVASKTAGKAPVTAPAQPAPKPVTVLTERGNGIKTTASFSVSGDWDLSYSFDCSSFGSQGNFAVTVNGGGDVYVNALADKGSDTTHQHNGPGKIALDVNSECAWSLKVIQLPG